MVRGILCLKKIKDKPNSQLPAISIVDEYLEHARVMIFLNGGKEKMYISSADLMVRNLDHRIEAAVPVTDPLIMQEISDIMNIQVSDNVKARILESSLSNYYVPSEGKKKVRSQFEIYHYLLNKIRKFEVSSN